MGNQVVSMGKLFLIAISLFLVSGIVLLITAAVSNGSLPYATYTTIFLVSFGGPFVLLVPELRGATRNVLLATIRVVFAPIIYRVAFAWIVRNAEQETYDNLRLLSLDKDQTFFAKTRQALDLIKTRDPLNYQRVRTFLRLITDFSYGHYDIYHQAYHANRFELKEESLESYASGIIHEAIHGRLQRCRTPYRANTARHESICKQVQLRFLTRIGAHELAQSLRSTRDWWLPQAKKEKIAQYVQSAKKESLREGGIASHLAVGWLTAIQKFTGHAQADGEPRVMRTYKEGNIDVSEVDYNGDGKTDGWIYAEGDTLLRCERDMNGDGQLDWWGSWEGNQARIELDTRGSGKIDRRFVLTDGLLSRSEWDTNGDGAADKIGVVRYYKQQTESVIYWFTSTGDVFAIEYRAGDSVIGEAAVQGGVVTNTTGRTRHKVGEKISETLEAFRDCAPEVRR